MFTRKSPTRFVVLFIMVLFVAAAFAIDTGFSNKEGQGTFITETSEVSVPAETATSTLTPTVTTTNTLVPTGTPTLLKIDPTKTATPRTEPTAERAYDPAAGPIILLVSSTDPPTLLEKILEQASSKGYEFVDFTNYEEVKKPFIVIFDNIPLGGVTSNQIRQIEVMSKYGNGVLAYNSFGKDESGAPYIKDLVVNQGWEIAIQGDGYTDVKNYTFDQLYSYIGYVQIKGQGVVYQDVGYFPQVWVPAFGTYGDTYMEFINDLNLKLITEKRLQILKSTGIHYIITDNLRSSLTSTSGPVEIYPYLTLSEVQFETLPY